MALVKMNLTQSSINLPRCVIFSTLLPETNAISAQGHPCTKAAITVVPPVALLCGTSTAGRKTASGGDTSAEHGLTVGEEEKMRKRCTEGGKGP